MLLTLEDLFKILKEKLTFILELFNVHFYAQHTKESESEKKTLTFVLKLFNVQLPRLLPRDHLPKKFSTQGTNMFHRTSISDYFDEPAGVFLWTILKS